MEYYTKEVLKYYVNECSLSIYTEEVLKYYMLMLMNTSVTSTNTTQLLLPIKMAMALAKTLISLCKLNALNIMLILMF